MDTKTQAYLDAQHQKYANQGHQETYETCFLLKHRHPLSVEYLARRKLYDSLPYAAAARYRYYSFVAPSDFCQLRLPALTMDGKMNWTNILSFDSWEYLVEIAELDGWPARAYPGIDRGTITVHTTQTQLLDELSALLNYPVCPEWDTDHYHLHLRELEAEDFDAVLGVIEVFHAGHLLITAIAEQKDIPDRLSADICSLTQPDTPNCWL